MKLPFVSNAVPRWGNPLTRWIGRSVFQISGWEIRGQMPDAPKFVVIGAPHTSNWDFILAMATIFALSVSVSWMGKESLFRWPLKRIFIWLGGIPIYRHLKTGLVEQTIAEFNTRDKLIVGITPEGTRKTVDGWKSGFYHIARGANVPIFPVSLDYKNRAIHMGPTLMPSGDMEKDIAKLKSFYVGIQGKYTDIK